MGVTLYLIRLGLEFESGLDLELGFSNTNDWSVFDSVRFGLIPDSTTINSFRTIGNNWTALAATIATMGPL